MPLTNNLTIELTGLTNHAVLVGAGSTTITKIAATATTGQIFQNNASADPSWSTATYPSTTTINQILYSSAANVVSGLATANNGVLTTGTSGIPVITALGSDGQLIIGSSAGAPAAATLTAGTGISITNGHNSISIAVNGSVVGQTITGNDATALSPSSGNWNIEGYNSAVTGYSPYTTGSGSTMQVQMPGTVKWVVNATANLGTHTTIQAAVTAAASGDDVFITPGTYTENITLKAGVNLVAYVCDASLSGSATTQITGKLTFTAAGTVNISGIQLNTNSDFFLAVTGSAASIVNLTNCYLNCGSTGISYSSSSGSSQINCFYCNGNLSTTGIAYFSMSSSGVLQFINCDLQNSGLSTTANTISAGICAIDDCEFSSPITTSSTGVFSAYNTNFNLSTNTTVMTIGGGTTGNIFYCYLGTGSASAISVSAAGFGVHHCVIFSTNTNAITGGGTVTVVAPSFVASSHKVNTTTFSGGAVYGITQGTAPSLGCIGEQIRSYESGVSMGGSASQNTITSINITAGIWDVSAIGTASVTTQNGNAVVFGISTTTNTFAGFNEGDGMSTINFVNTNLFTSYAVSIPSVRITLSATTTYYLVGQINKSGGTSSFSGRISATRVG